MISRGKEKLKELGVHSDIFMAPGHAYDEDTLKALRSCGFKYVTDGYGEGPYMYKGLKFLPIAMLRSFEMKAPIGITTFVVQTWEMKDSDFDEYEKLFEENRDRFVDYERMISANAHKKDSFMKTLEYGAAVFKRLIGKFVK